MPTPTENRKRWPERYGRKVPEPNARQRAVLSKLAELGAERAELVSRKAYTTTAGRVRLDKIYDQIRQQIERGAELRLLHDEMREQVGVNSTAYYKIKNGRTGSGS
jgi:hypothetical protein